MANRRMFSLDVVGTDAFLDMPLTAQALYFHLGMRADDDGFVGNSRMIQRMVGCNDDDFRLLLAKGFIIPFNSGGVCVIRHWKIHNYIRSDRYKKTVYTNELSTLSIAQNGAYSPMNTVGIPNVNQATYQMETQDRLGKDNNILCSPDAEQECLSEKKQPSKPNKKTALEQDKEDFEKIYAIYPKKRGRTRAFELYRQYVKNGRMISGTHYKLDRREIYLAVVAYVQQMEETGTDLQFYKNFDTFLCKAILDYLPEGGDSNDTGC